MANSPKVINGIYQISGNTITGMSPVTLEYSLGSDLNIEKLRFEQLSPVFRENTGFGQLQAFEGSMYFYNFGIGDYELISPGKTEFEDWELEAYLSPGHTIIVRYVCDSAAGYGNVVLPMLYVTGRER